MANLGKLISRKRILIVLVSLAFISLHLFPFINNSSHPLGYDSGFYRRFLIQPSSSFFSTPSPGMGQEALIPRVVLDIGKLMEIPTDFLLYGSYFVLFLGIFVAIYLLAEKKFGAEVFFYSILLFTISSVAYTFFWFMLWKQALALLFLLLLIYWWDDKPRLAYLSVIVIAFSHQTTSIILLLVLFLYLLLNVSSWRKIGGAIILLLVPQILFHFKEYEGLIRFFPVAVFMTTTQFLLLSWPFLIFAFAGIKNFLVVYGRSLFGVFVFVTILYPLFRLPFYERVFIFTDISLVLLGGYGFSLLVDRLEKFKMEGLFVKPVLILVFVSMVLGGALGGLQKTVKTHKPLISESFISKILSETKLLGPDSTVLTTAELAPWVFGFSQSHVVAPGLLRDKHTQEDWILYWKSGDKERLAHLLVYQRPLYIFVPEDEVDAFVPQNECVEKKSPNLFSINCF